MSTKLTNTNGDLSRITVGLVALVAAHHPLGKALSEETAIGLVQASLQNLAVRRSILTGAGVTAELTDEQVSELHLPNKKPTPAQRKAAKKAAAAETATV